MFGKQLDKTFNKPLFWGAIAGAAIGAIASSRNSSKANKSAEAQTDKWINYQREIGTEHEQLDKISSGKYGDFMSNYAFGSPEEQGKWGREMQSAMYPELNAWELAGSSSAGVAGAVGQDANNQAQQAQAREHDTQMKTMQVQADLAKTKMMTDAQRDVATVQSYTKAGEAATNALTQKYAVDKQTETQKEVNKNTTETNLEITRMQNAQAQKALDMQAPKVEAEIRQIGQNMKLTKANTQVAVEKAVNLAAERMGIYLSNESKALANEYAMKSMDARVQNQYTGNSTVGKFATDIGQAVNKAWKEVLEMSTETGTFEELRQGIGSFFGGDSKQNDTRTQRNPLQGE